MGLPVLIARLRFAAIAGAIAASTSIAAAQPNDAATARAVALFDDARALSAKGDHAAACPLYEQSFALVPGLGTQLNLGDCWARTGRLVAAIDLFRDLAARATAAGQAERARIARDSVVQLEPRLPRVIVTLPSGVTGRVTIDKREVQAGAISIAVDPGSHTAELVTDDDRRAEATWVAIEGHTATIKLEPPQPIEPDPDPTVDPDPTPPPLIVDPIPPPLPPLRRRLALWTGIAAVAGVGTTAWLVIEARRIKDDAVDAGCVIDGDDHATCPDQASADEMTRARRYLDAGTIVGIAGVALGAVAIVLYATSPEPYAATTTVQPWLGRHGGGIAVERRW